MGLEQILKKTCVVAGLSLASKKAALETISKLFAKNLAQDSAHDFFQLFVEREKIGSTALGHGVALPHILIENIKQPIAAFLQLKNGIDFTTPIEERVDLIFALAVPNGNEEQYLQLLAQISEKLHDEQLRKKLRTAQDSNTLYQLLIS